MSAAAKLATHPPPPSSPSSPIPSYSSPTTKPANSLLPPLHSLLAWARLKKYRIEVTYGVYVYTPGEKLVFWALFLSLFVLISGALAQYVLWHIAAPLARWVVTGSCRHLFGGGGGVRDGAGAAGVAGMRMRMGRGTEMGGRAAVRSQGA